jgi:ligand-binding sensor domain-containing protein/signal transduction histidine kinase
LTVVGGTPVILTGDVREGILSLIDVAGDRMMPFLRRIESWALVSALVASALFSLPAITLSQTDYIFERITVEQGLSNDHILCLYSDSEGFLWIGTTYGLNKYDGNNFTIFKPSREDLDTISALEVTSICEDQEGNLWIGTAAGGVNRLDKRTTKFTHYKHQQDDPDSTGSNDVKAVVAGEEGVVWIGTDGGGIDKLNWITGEMEHFRSDRMNLGSLCSDYITSLCYDPQGFLWIGTTEGLCRYDVGGDTFATYKHDPADSMSLSNNLIQSLYLDDYGFLWIGTYGGLNRFDGRSRFFQRFFSELQEGGAITPIIFSSLHIDSAGVVYAGTLGSGLYILDPGKGTTLHLIQDPASSNSLVDNFINAVHVDGSGLLWIGTNSHGLNKFRRTGIVHYFHRPNEDNSLVDNSVFALHEDEDGTVWIGTGGGLDRLDRSAGKFTHYRWDERNRRSLGSDIISAIAQTEKDKIWVGTVGGGLNRLDKSTGTFERFLPTPEDQNSLGCPTVVTLHADSDNVLWIGLSDSGLNRFNGDRGDFTRYPFGMGGEEGLSGSSVFAICDGNSGILWIGTDGGLNRFEKATERFVSFPITSEEQAEQSRVVNSLFLDSSGLLWVGTLQGLKCFDPSLNRFITFAGEAEIPGNVFFGIQEDGAGKLWISTNNGLVSFDPDTGDFRVFLASDGVQADEFNSGALFRSLKGEMFFGGVNGFNCFLPDAIRMNTREPNIVIVGAAMNMGQVDLMSSLNLGNPLFLDYNDKWLTFEFAALDFAQPAKNQYKYMLEGFDTDWVECGNNRVATYSTLTPGIYTFKVAGANSDGVWNEEGASVRIIVNPPYWDEWWFRALVVLGVVGLIVLLYVARVSSINAQRKRLTREVAERTHELESFTYSVSHHLKVPLWRADGYFNLLEMDHACNLDGEGRKYLAKLMKICGHMQQTIEDMLKLSRATSSEIVRQPVDMSRTAKIISAGLRDNELQRKVTFNILDGCVAEGDERLLYIVLENLLGNAWKFTGKTNHAKIDFGSFQRRAKEVFFVRDNGAGFAPEDADKLFTAFQRLHSEEDFPGVGVGLATVQRIVKRHGGEIWAEGQPGKGATFYFTLE